VRGKSRRIKTIVPRRCHLTADSRTNNYILHGLPTHPSTLVTRTKTFRRRTAYCVSQSQSTRRNADFAKPWKIYLFQPAPGSAGYLDRRADDIYQSTKPAAGLRQLRWYTKRPQAPAQAQLRHLAVFKTATLNHSATTPEAQKSLPAPASAGPQRSSAKA
jgi:hypothetical protein